MGANTNRTWSQIVAEEEDPTFARMAEIQGRLLHHAATAAVLANTQLVAEDAVTACAT